MDIEYTESCGNVFKDLGMENPGVYAIKASLFIQINKSIRSRNVYQKEIAALLSCSQSVVSHLTNNNFKKFSIERLIKILEKLEPDIIVYPGYTV
jgi:predicted XRE-type DNA-binding protein